MVARFSAESGSLTPPRHHPGRVDALAAQERDHLLAELAHPDAIAGYVRMGPHQREQVSAGRVGVQLNPSFSNSAGVQSSEYHGVAVTYAQVATNPALHRRRTEAEFRQRGCRGARHGGLEE